MKETITSVVFVAKTTSVHTVGGEDRTTIVDTIEVVDSDTDDDVLMCDQPLRFENSDEELHKVLKPVDDTLGDTNRKRRAALMYDGSVSDEIWRPYWPHRCGCRKCRTTNFYSDCTPKLAKLLG